MKFSRQEYWSELAFPSPRDLPFLGIKPGSPALQPDYLSSEPPGKPNTVHMMLLFDAPLPIFFLLVLIMSQKVREYQGAVLSLTPCHHKRGTLNNESGTEGKESACNVGDLGLIPGSGRSPVEGNGFPLHYSCLENRMDRGAWQVTVHGVTKIQTRLSD